MIETYRGAVYPWHCDQMGHMNVMWYVGKFDEATWNLFATIGVTTAWMRENKRGMAAVQQDITYKRELLAGDTIAVRSVFLEVREKTVKFVHEMRHALSGEISAICVLTGVQIDSETRKSCPFPAEVAERGRALVGSYNLARP
jgi:acyl-CoA thioester hydrolase